MKDVVDEYFGLQDGRDIKYAVIDTLRIDDEEEQLMKTGSVNLLKHANKLIKKIDALAKNDEENTVTSIIYQTIIMNEYSMLYATLNVREAGTLKIMRNIICKQIEEHWDSFDDGQKLFIMASKFGDLDAGILNNEDKLIALFR